MSWSLQITNGDFAVRGSQLSVVTGAQKLVQDLRVTLLEKMGTDDLHLGFGSLIDGGTLPSGTVIPSIIGTSDPNLAAAAIRSDVKRICEDYQKRQVARVKDEKLKYNKSTLTPDEILVGVSNIAITQTTDSLFVTISLKTGAGTQTSLSVPVTNEPLTR
jgi:hypothetical protein